MKALNFITPLANSDPCLLPSALYYVAITTSITTPTVQVEDGTRGLEGTPMTLMLYDTQLEPMSLTNFRVALHTTL